VLFTPKVTFIVPAFNEEKGIARTIESLLDTNYAKKEIIVVDDGSTDKTADIAKKYEKFGVQVLIKQNTGKASSINYALSYANGEIIITVDADSLVNKYAVDSIIRRFQDKNVMAVCGNVKVLNRINILTKLQALEYITDINLAKRAFDIFGSTLVVPGVFGAYRKSALQASGKMDIDTITEDFDTTMKSLKAGGVVQATSFALAYTEAPESLKDLYKQRLRWYEGTFQTLIKHRDIISNPRFGMTAEIGVPYLLMGIFFMPIVSFVSLGILIYLSLTGYSFNTVVLVGMFILLESLLSLLSIIIDEEDWHLIIFAPLFVIGYRQFRDFVKLKAFYNVIFKRSGGWRRVERMGRADELLRKLGGRRK
jgi:cellulose synthase/poly-beta-1,6-N-acetylglucosamine synthase-like glycosyltransferase